MNRINQIPSSKDIAEVENKLAQMKEAREQAARQVAIALKSEDVIDAMRPDDLLVVFNKIQARIRGSHKRRRGSPVPDTLKDALIKEIISGTKTLAEIESSLGLSISYISKVKRHLKDAGVLPMNAYTDRQLKHQTKPAEIHELQPA